MIKFLARLFPQKGELLATLNIVSTGPGAGKTCLAGALATGFRAKERTVAYYKPLSVNPEADPDVEFIGRLLGSSGLSQATVPAPFDQPIDSHHPPTRLSETRREEIAEAVVGMEADFDEVLIEWAAPAVPPGQPVWLVHSCPSGQKYEEMAALLSGESEKYGDHLTGVVINNVPRHRAHEVEDKVVAPLRNLGLPLLGAIPEDREMLALTFRQVAEYLGGRWVEEPADMELCIDRFLIGGNILDSGPNYFGRYPHQAIIARAERPDIQMASLMCNTRLLVLTGGQEPTEYIPGGGTEAERLTAAGGRQYPGGSRVAGGPAGRGKSLWGA